MTNAEKIEARVSSMSVEALKAMARQLFTDTRDGAEIVFSAVLAALDAKMPEAEFVAFCEAFE